ncbi:MAG: hypothetical protein RL885_13945 [Planctomycetota bacterium]
MIDHDRTGKTGTRSGRRAARIERIQELVWSGVYDTGGKFQIALERLITGALDEIEDAEERARRKKIEEEAEEVED